MLREAKRRLKQIISLTQKHYREEKAKIDGVAISRARMIVAPRHVIEEQLTIGVGPRIATSIGPGGRIRMLDGMPMQVFSDGSIRHAFGHGMKASLRRAAKRKRNQDAAAARQASR